MADPFDVDLEDPVLLDEIALLTEVVVAATASPIPLTPEAVDDLLTQVPLDPGAADDAHRVRGPG
jgi:hypothetical protein